MHTVALSPLQHTIHRMIKHVVFVTPAVATELTSGDPAGGENDHNSGSIVKYGPRYIAAVCDEIYSHDAVAFSCFRLPAGVERFDAEQQLSLDCSLAAIVHCMYTHDVKIYTSRVFTGKELGFTIFEWKNNFLIMTAAFADTQPDSQATL